MVAGDEEEEVEEAEAEEEGLEEVAGVAEAEVNQIQPQPLTPATQARATRPLSGGHSLPMRWLSAEPPGPTTLGLAQLEL